MSHRLWKHRITDILDSINKIQKYVEDMEFDDFQKHEKTIELDQDQINRIKSALNAKSEKETLNAVLSQFDTEILLTGATLRDAGNFDFEEL